MSISVCLIDGIIPGISISVRAHARFCRISIVGRDEPGIGGGRKRGGDEAGDQQQAHQLGEQMARPGLELCRNETGLVVVHGDRLRYGGGNGVGCLGRRR